MSTDIVSLIDKTEPRFLQIAPAGMKWEAEKGFAVQLLRSNPYLEKAAIGCPESLLQAVTNIAALGLSLNPAAKEAYLITRNIKVSDKQWQTRVCLDPSYMGLCRLATDSGIKWIQANVVYANDTFTDNGPGREPDHQYQPFSKDRGEFVGVYCVAKTHEGDFLTTIMPADEVYGIRDRSEAWKRSKSGPWATDFNEMAKKSVVRRAFKMWPKSTGLARMAEAVELSNQNEGFEQILTTPDIRNFTADQKAYFDQLISTSDGWGLFLMNATLDYGIWTNLYHSFDRGQKGKMQHFINDLVAKGAVKFEECRAAIIEYRDGDDHAGALEVLEGIGQEGAKLMRDRVDAHTLKFINEIGETA